MKNATQKNELTCPKCHGDGGHDEIEGTRQVFQACYHCGNTGRIDRELYRQDQLDSALANLASINVAALMVEGQDADVCYRTMAAENMIPFNQLIDDMHYRELNNLKAFVEGLGSGSNRKRVEDLLIAGSSTIPTMRQAIPTPPPAPKPAPAPIGNPDDIPF